MGTRTDKIKIAIALVPVVRAEVCHLGELVAQAMSGTPRQVVSVFSILGDEAHFDLDMAFQVGHAGLGQALKHEGACSFLDC
jgi:hypothetical protein